MIFLLFLISFPSTYGGKGIYRIKSADTEWLLDARSILILNVDGEGYRYDYDPDPDYTDYGVFRIGFCYVPHKAIETYMIWHALGQGQLKQPASESDWTGDMGDVNIGTKFALKKIKNSYIGGDASVTLPVGREGYTNERFIFYPKLLGTLDLGDYFFKFPMRTHLNAGVPFGRKDLSGNFPVFLGFAWELPSKYFTYFMEITNTNERDFHWRVSPGIKMHPIYRLSITVAADIGLVTEYRVFGANAGISLNSSLTREREILPTGNIAGEIKDKQTGQPIEGQIRLVELDEDVKSDQESGVYKFLGIPKGVYTVKVAADYYTPLTKLVIIETNKATILNFDLDRYQVRYEGIVIDQNTSEPIAGATISIDGRSEAYPNTNEQGVFQSAIIPGDYKIKVNKENYALYTATTSILADRYDTISLRPVEMVGEVPEAIVYFDLNDANIRDDQRPTLDRIAEFLKSHPKIKCELRGHTDPSGNIDYNQILSLARANSVRDYFVKVHGVEKERIATLAFSKTKLIKESPEQSRRVEIFLIR